MAERGFQPKGRVALICALGIGQIFAWGGSFYLMAVIASPVVSDTGWPFAWVVGGLSLALFISACVSPFVGSKIQTFGGRPSLLLSSVVLSAGLCVVAASQTLTIFLLGWCVIGIGMAAGLYDAAFATLGVIYGTAARSTITTLTLVSGFSSTIAWPLSAVLVELWGWRATCVAYAFIQLLVCLPFYAWAVPPGTISSGRQKDDEPQTLEAASTKFFIVIACIVSCMEFISSALSVHVLTVLEAIDFSAMGAVAVAALIGPSQVAARIIELMAGGRHHPVWTMAAASSLVLSGLALLLLAPIAATAAICVFGMGRGLSSVSKGTVPLALFGPQSYARILGRLAMPALLAQALAPSATAAILDIWGVHSLVFTLVSLAGLSATLGAWLVYTTRFSR